MLNLKIELSEEDLFNFSYSHWMAPDNRRYRIQYFIKAFIYSCLGALIIIPFRISASNTLLTAQDIIVILITGLLLAFVFTFILIKQSIRRKVTRILADAKNANMLSKAELQISNAGIEETDAVSKMNYKWAAIIKEMETKEYFFLYTNSLQAIIIPKKVLNSSELSTLKQILSENLNLSVQLK